MSEPLFTDQEYKKLFLKACEAKGGATEEQIFAFIKLFEEARAQEKILQLVLCDLVTVIGYTEDNEPIFSKSPNN